MEKITKDTDVFRYEEEQLPMDKLRNISEFNNITYDGPFKTVFSIKRILAIVIKETIKIYEECTIDEIVSLIESVVPEVKTKQNDDKITMSESHVRGESTVKFDILVKVGVPLHLIDKTNSRYIQIKLNLEMQKNSTPGYSLAYRGLYYGSRLISDQLPAVTDNNADYDDLVPVYSIWVVLVGKNTDAANTVLSYHLKNSSISAEKSNSYVNKMNAVEDLLNIYFICIDKSILESKKVEDGLEQIVEFISLLFVGHFEDERLQKHDKELQTTLNKYRKEIGDMAKYYSEVEQMLREEREEGREEGASKGIIRMALKFGKDKDFIISSLVTELSITTEKAKEYYDIYSK